MCYLECNLFVILNLSSQASALLEMHAGCITTVCRRLQVAATCMQEVARCSSMHAACMQVACSLHYA